MNRFFKKNTKTYNIIIIIIDNLQIIYRRVRFVTFCLILFLWVLLGMFLQRRVVTRITCEVLISLFTRKKYLDDAHPATRDHSIKDGLLWLHFKQNYPQENQTYWHLSFQKLFWRKKKMFVLQFSTKICSNGESPLLACRVLMKAVEEMEKNNTFLASPTTNNDRMKINMFNKPK